MHPVLTIPTYEGDARSLQFIGLLSWLKQVLLRKTLTESFFQVAREAPPFISSPKECLQEPEKPPQREALKASLSVKHHALAFTLLLRYGTQAQSQVYKDDSLIACGVHASSSSCFVWKGKLCAKL